jgi:nicotinate-nucleotide--dimethylbenzimidazole phosphoribosyltransferase
MRFEEVVNGIKPLDETVMKESWQRIDNLVKPIGSLGRLEELAAQISGITGKVFNTIHKKCIVVMAADNGVYEEGFSTVPQELTLIQTVNFTKGITGINVLARHACSDLRIIDIGIKDDLDCPGVHVKKIRKGTANMAKEPAMSRAEAVHAIEVGIEIVTELAENGYGLLGTGEMGIANTTTSSAILMAFTGCKSDLAVGKGAGLTEASYIHKKMVIEKALELNQPNSNDPLDVLSKVGGLDIAGLTGCFLAAAYHRLPIVIDGFISAAAALVAFKINPQVKAYLVPSHASLEPGYGLIMKELDLEPMLNLKMRLGEGTGCPLAFHIVEAALEMMNHMATFEEANITSDKLVDIREDA